MDCATALEAAQTMAAPAGGVPTPSYYPPPGQPRTEVIGDFEILDKIGQGGMGAVYRARQITLDRVVALKLLPEYFADDEDAVARFQREARVSAGLAHANLVHVFSSGVISGTHFIAMEFVEGENLRQRMKRERLSIPEALHICAEVARGLRCGWEKAHLIHRDIKPGNIFLSTRGEVKVGDLGIARSLSGASSRLTQTGSSLGTALYMSPEQVRGDKTFDFRADIYSLGCTLYEMLTGQPPYTAADSMSVMRLHLDAPLPAILKVLPGCPIPLARLVGRMLKKHARERHESYADLIAEIEQVRAQIESGAAHAGPSKVVEAWKQIGEMENSTGTPFDLLWAGLILLLLVGGGVGWWAIQPKTPRSVSATPLKASATPTPKLAAATPAPPPGSAAPHAAVGTLTFGGHRYQFVPGMFSWSEAKARAEAMGGHLATVTSKEEDEQLIAVLKGILGEQRYQFVVHIGGSWQEGAWHWVTGEPFAYQHWQEGEPNDAGQPQRHLAYWNKKTGDFGWADDPNATAYDHIRGFLLEWDYDSDAGTGRWENLLAGLDVEKARRQGDWKMEGGALICTKPSNYATCELPVEDPGLSYDLRYRITRGPGSKLAVFLPFRRGDTGGTIVLDYFNSTFGDGLRRAGLEVIAGTQFPDNALTAKRPMFLPEGQQTTVLLQVREKTLTLFVGDEQIFRWEADWPKLTQSRGDGKFGTVVFQSVMTFHSIDLRKVVEGTAPQAAAEAASAGQWDTATKDAPFHQHPRDETRPRADRRRAEQMSARALLDLAHPRAGLCGGAGSGGAKVDGSWKAANKDGVPIGRESDHPVVGVSRESVQAFCAWLTGKETAEGRLPKGGRYRLPNDEEWSWAVGLPPEVDGTPEVKNGKNDVAFPWGREWPPTRKVGNYTDETFHAKFPVKRNEKESRVRICG